MILPIVIDDGSRLSCKLPNGLILEYTELSRIGEGTTSKVYSGLAQDGSRVALKVLSTASLRQKKVFSPSSDGVLDLPPPPTAMRTGLDVLRDEVSLLSTLRHPGLATYSAAMESSKKVVLVMQLLPDPLLRTLSASTLFEYEQTPVGRASRQLLQLLDALRYLHLNGVAHFDVSPDNLRLDQLGNAFLVDFGNLKRVGIQAGPYGAIAFSPPESFTGPFDAAAADIWALGVVMCTALAGRLPYDLEEVASTGQDEGSRSPSAGDATMASRLSCEISAGRIVIPETVRVTDGESYPSPTPAALRDLLKGMLQPDPASRLTAELALRHRWWTEAESALAARAVQSASTD